MDSSHYMVLPCDLVSTVLLMLLDPRTIGRIACASSTLRIAADSRTLWMELYKHRWMQLGSVLREADSFAPSIAGNPFRLLYQQRMAFAVPMAINDGVHVFEGKVRNDKDGSETPVKVVLGFQKGRVGGHAQRPGVGHTSKTSPPSETAFVGMYGPAKAGEGSGGGWTIQWDETFRKSKTKWSYSGKFGPDGMSITGTYQTKLDPRTGGTFHLKVTPSESVPTFTELSLKILQLTTGRDSPAL
mmetsp:Transcript_2285/g.4771  ORF Transcript_2285/g.4771 Transcript_2285/m.4771 type:complete len:243 (+) Transcript_2285:74-802(+)|eukprot:CAMPEP_0178421322 /NCGR_PEP_ID=MMETSP0689_2-20121128/26587_1 /TAXON_ID=160604 /ORGANISM="Amphidinium massartii, Strain CS-259" /LENGTH=242 /DNA_ID=CAMNT_0020042829 /DNA_START=60 /DNA_END=788 /DNA_ORIENTATION=-